MESSIGCFVAAALTREHRDLLAMLFVPPEVFQASPNIPGFLVITNIRGSIKELEEIEEMIQTGCKVRMQNAIIKIWPRVLNSMTDYTTEIVKIIASEPSLQTLLKEGDERAARTAMLLLVERANIIEKMNALIGDIIRDEVREHGLSMIQSVMGLIMISILRYIRNRANLLVRFLGENLSRTIFLLKRCNLVSHILTVAICPRCLNYVVAFATADLDIDKCPSCGKNMAVGVLYCLSNDYAALKSSRKDLPYFIANYILVRAVSFGFPVEEDKVEVNRYVEDVEIDVYIKDLHVGIECKIFSKIEPVNQATMRNWINNLCEKIDKYVSAGIKEMLVVTNVPTDQLASIHEALVDYARKHNYQIDVKVLSKEPDRLLEELDRIAKSLAERRRYYMKREAEEKARKLLGDLKLFKEAGSHD